MSEVRIRQFAQLMCQSEFLFSESLQQTDIEVLRSLLHLQPLSEADSKRITMAPAIGQVSIDILLINTILPYRYAYAIAHHDIAKAQQAIELIALLPAENNTVIRQWRMLGQTVRSAADTQALIHLYQNYCQPHLCFNCQIGHQVFGYKQLELF